MRKIITGFMEPNTDISEILSARGNGIDRTDVNVWEKAVLDYDIPVKVTIEIDQKYISEALAERLYKEGWTHDEN